MRFTPQFLDELRARLPVSEVVGRRVKLRKAGREWKGLSPFNQEKTPSFFVNDQKAMWFDFSSGKNGNIFDFLMLTEGVSFPEAVERLAGQAGLPVPVSSPEAEAREERRKTLHDIVELAAKFFETTLASRNGARGRGYLADRGLASATQLKFRLGYAPAEQYALKEHLGAAKIPVEDMVEAGLIVAGEDIPVPYDRFRDRIMFPIRDGRGRVIAFGGRVVDAGEPKYLNSPETVLFHKGRELYGLYETRRARSSLKRLVIVEGYMDAVRLHQEGIDYAVATLGTATTAEHFRRIFRLVPEVVFAFDGDRAGRGAAWRALQQSLPEAREGRQIRFLFLPEGHDPDTLVAAEGRAAFEQRLGEALPLSEYLVRELSEQSDLTHADGRARFAESARPLYQKVPEGVYRELLLGRLAQVVGLPSERLEELWSKAPGAPVAAPPAPRRPERVRSAGRGSLVRQAIVRLVHFPSIAAEVSSAERSALDDSEEAGIKLLRELLDNLREQPAQISAQVIQRWAGREGGESLQKLLEREEVITDAAAAAGELRAALVKLADLAAERRLQALEAKSRSGPLTAEELQEFQRLMSILSAREARRG